MKILMFLIGLAAAQAGFVGIVMYQARNISTSLWDITKYTLMVTPLLIVINIVVNLVTNFGNKIFNNLSGIISHINVIVNRYLIIMWFNMKEMW